MKASRQFCTFYLGDHVFGVDAKIVQEVIRFQDMTRVPLAPPSVGGLINLRGQIVTAIDLRKRLRYPPLPKDSKPMNVVIRTDEGAVSLLVDSIGEVIQCSEESFENVPETLDKNTRDLIGGTYKLEDRLLLLLNTTAAISDILVA